MSMQLAKYISSGRASSAELGRKLGVSRQCVDYWARRMRRMDPQRAKAIERATGGLVTAEEAIGLVGPGRRRPIIIRK